MTDRFRGKVEDAWLLPGRGLVVHLTEITGHPEVGATVCLAGKTRDVLALGENSTDGQAVSTRSCLTGAPVSPYGAVLVSWTEAAPERGALSGTWLIGKGAS